MPRSKKNDTWTVEHAADSAAWWVRNPDGELVDVNEIAVWIAPDKEQMAALIYEGRRIATIKNRDLHHIVIPADAIHTPVPDLDAIGPESFTHATGRGYLAYLLLNNPEPSTLRAIANALRAYRPPHPYELASSGLDANQGARTPISSPATLEDLPVGTLTVEQLPEIADYVLANFRARIAQGERLWIA